MAESARKKRRTTNLGGRPRVRTGDEVQVTVEFPLKDYARLAGYVDHRKVEAIRNKESVAEQSKWFGDENLVFSTDYPHGDSQYPHAVEAFEKLPLSDESKRKILLRLWQEYWQALPPKLRREIETEDRFLQEMQRAK